MTTIATISTYQCEKIFCRRLSAITLLYHFGNGRQNGQHFLVQIGRLTESVQESGMKIN